MQRDIRETPLYRETEALYRTFRRPGSGLIADAAEISAHGGRAVFTGTLVDSANEAVSRICLTDVGSGDTRVLSFGPNTDRAPRLSPDGRRIAFLSDRRKAGDFQLYLLDAENGECRATPPVDGWVEYLHWSPSGRRILLGVAGHGADLPGAQGAATSKTSVPDLPAWIPAVDTGEEAYRWRRAWVYDLEENSVSEVSPADANIWEAAWCGNDAITAIVSPGPSEGLWYTARLAVIETDGGARRDVYVPQDQLGWPSASPSGRHIAVVEALCSDRWVVAGDLRLIDARTREARKVATRGIDICHTEWRSDRHLLLAGHRGFETVVALYDLETATLDEVWKSGEITTGGFYTTIAGFGEPGDCALVGEGFRRAPEIAVIRRGEYQSVKSFDPGAGEALSVLGGVETAKWRAPDGLEIQGLVLKPSAGEAPHPTILMVHGGPVWHFRPYWMGRRSAATLMLLKRGFAIFLPNPRGSTGRGQDFVRPVLGDMGGADTYDYLSGLDHLVERGIADPARLGVTGASYGGYMTAWLITQDPRFAAAVAVSPVTNQVTEHLISNIGFYVALFLKDTYVNPGGKYFDRSPIMHAHKTKTPTLSTCGVLDRCTPPEEAVQFHNALLENGVKSVLVTYPQEGHGVRKWPAVVDYAARMVGWFEEHITAARSR
ncbi:MAG TPA: S9 family peptidase [Steroidobacteraceae bacterium]|nr:S9 family peptidase [Steroidobacteraceae bacterium]